MVNFIWFGACSVSLNSKIDLLYSSERSALTAGDPRTIKNARNGCREDKRASLGVVEPTVARIVGVRPSRTPALPKFALVYSVATCMMQLNVFTQYCPYRVMRSA